MRRAQRYRITKAIAEKIAKDSPEIGQIVLYLRAFGIGGAEIAVGTVIAHCPPHRPGRAGFPHPVLTLSV